MARPIRHHHTIDYAQLKTLYATGRYTAAQLAWRFHLPIRHVRSALGMDSLPGVLWPMASRKQGWTLHGRFVGAHCELTVRDAQGVEICRFRLTWPDYLAAVKFWIETKHALREGTRDD